MASRAPARPRAACPGRRGTRRSLRRGGPGRGAGRARRGRRPRRPRESPRPPSPPAACPPPSPRAPGTGGPPSATAPRGGRTRRADRRDRCGSRRSGSAPRGRDGGRARRDPPRCGPSPTTTARHPGRRASSAAASRKSATPFCSVSRATTPIRASSGPAPSSWRTAALGRVGASSRGSGRLGIVTIFAARRLAVGDQLGGNRLRGRDEAARDRGGRTIEGEVDPSPPGGDFVVGDRGVHARDDHRNAGEARGDPPVEARARARRVHEIRPRQPEVTDQREHGPGAHEAGEVDHGHGVAPPAYLVGEAALARDHERARVPGVVEPVGEGEHPLLAAPDVRRGVEVDDPRRLGAR